MLQISDIPTPYIANFSDLKSLRLVHNLLKQSLFFSDMQNSLLFLCTGDFILSSTHRSRQVPDYHLLFIIKQYSYRSKSLQVIFCYGSYTWFAKLLRGGFIWMSYSCWYEGTRVLLLSLLSVYQGCQMARVLQISSLHSSRSW